MFLSLCWYLVIVNILLNLTQKIYCHDPQRHRESYASYGQNRSFERFNPTGSDERRYLQSHGVTSGKQVLKSYDNYRQRSVRSVSYSSVRGNHSNSSGGWLPNRVDGFKEHERNYNLNTSRMNNAWNNTSFNRTNPTRYNMNTTYPRRRQEGMFLNTTAPERHRNITYSLNRLNMSLPNSYGRNQFNTTSRNFYGNNTYNRTMPTNRLNTSYPFISRWNRSKRYIDYNLYNSDKYSNIRNFKENEFWNKEENQDRGHILNIRKWLYATPPVATTSGERLQFYDKYYPIAESEEISNNIIDKYPLVIDYSLKNRLENNVEILKDDFPKSEEEFEENLYNNNDKTIKGLNDPHYTNNVIELSNEIVDDYDNNILLKNEQIALEQQILSGIYPTLSDRKKMLQKRKEDNKKYYEDSNNIETTISTLVNKLKTTPKYRNIGSNVNINRILQRDEIIGDNVKPVLQLTTLSVLNQPHDDTVLIQVPPRRITCPPNTRLARGRCRTVW